MTEAVSLGELLHEEALFGLTGVGKVEDAYFRLDFASRHISSSLCVTDPLPTGFEWGWKKMYRPYGGRS